MLMVFLSVAALVVVVVISRRSLSGRPGIDRAIKGSLVDLPGDPSGRCAGPPPVGGRVQPKWEYATVPTEYRLAPTAPTEDLALTPVGGAYDVGKVREIDPVLESNLRGPVAKAGAMRTLHRLEHPG